MTGVGKRGVGSAKSKKTYKQGLRKTFQKRHIDQVRCAGLAVLYIQYLDVQAQLRDSHLPFIANSHLPISFCEAGWNNRNI